ncbi:hypothetical protein Tco_1015515 [Tanacetum coccineum]|uniref:Uncharacterized protein n=1 Tax=Tanacetum coccineum TaxID=301880 RepID=A0ABQ5FM63_9ASTR
MNFFRTRKVGMIWSFGFLGVCKRTRISFVYEYGLAIEWNSEDLTELLEGESDEFVLNHEGDENEVGVISLKSDLTIKVQNKTRDNWLINFVETIETYVRKTMIDVIRCVVKLINNSTLMNASILDRFVEVCDSRRNTGCLGYFGNVRTGTAPSQSTHVDHVPQITEVPAKTAPYVPQIRRGYGDIRLELHNSNAGSSTTIGKNMRPKYWDVEKFHKSIIAAIKEEKNQEEEGRVPLFRVQLNLRGHKSRMKARLFWKKFMVACV